MRPPERYREGNDKRAINQCRDHPRDKDEALRLDVRQQMRKDILAAYDDARRDEQLPTTCVFLDKSSMDKRDCTITTIGTTTQPSADTYRATRSDSVEVLTPTHMSSMIPWGWCDQAGR